MEFRVVEVKWSREGSFFGQPPIQMEQPEITKVINDFAREGWLISDIHHEVGDNLRFSIITLVRQT